MTAFDVEVLHRDRHLVVVNKPPGIDVHGHSVDDPASLISLVARRLSLHPARLHPASRLDRPVSGVVPIATTKVARRSLTQQYERREVRRRYVALVVGVPDPPEGEWTGAIGTSRADPRTRTIGGRDARPAATSYRVLRTVDDAWSFVELAPRTGRTHQLRVHLSLVAGCPIVGDRRYGGPTTIALSNGSIVSVPRVLLHAATISLRHPESDVPLFVEAPLWPDFRDVLEQLGRAPFDP